MEGLQNLDLSWQEPAQHVVRISSIVLALTILALVGRAIYNVFFSPLRAYPGPKLWAATRLFNSYYATRGTLVWKIQELHDKYGPVVRTAPTELSYITSQAWKDIYGHRAREMSKVMDGRGGILPPPAGGISIITAGRQDHSRMRRNLAHAFSEKALRDQESYIQMYVDRLISAVRTEAGTSPTQDILRWYNFTTFDVIGDLAFGEPFGCLQNNKYHSWITTIFHAIQSTPWVQFATFYGIGKQYWKYFMPAGLAEARLNNYEISAEKMDRRMAITEDRKDFTSYMLKHNDEKGMSTQELRNMSTTLIIAGSETTATLLTGLTYNLLKYPRVYNKLAAEVRERFSSEEEITMLAVQELKYMQVVLEEGLRVYPPVPTALPRAVPAGGDIIDGKWVPENTAVGVAQFSAYHSEENFHRAKEFIPERWLPVSAGGSEEFANDNKAVHQPFSHGPRNCIGKNLAYAEMRIILSRILFNFDLELDKSSDNWDQQTAPLLWKKQPLVVKVTDRQAVPAA